MKKRLIVIACVILAMSICISFASCSGKKYKDIIVDSNGQEVNLDDITGTTKIGTDENGETVIYVEDANGETTMMHIRPEPQFTSKGYTIGAKVTKKGETTAKKTYEVEDDKLPTVQGNTVAVDNGDTTTKKNKPNVTKPIKTTIPQTGTTANRVTKPEESTQQSDSTTKATTKATTKPTTTKPTTTFPAMTTTDTGGAIVLPDLPADDDYKFTPSLAMFVMQNKYDSEKYVVNCYEADENYTTLSIYTKKNGKVYSTAKVNLKNGKTVETKWETKEKTEYVLEF